MKRILPLLFCAFTFGFAFSQTCKDASVELTAVVQKSPPRITLKWPTNAATNTYYIFRKSKTATNFGSIYATLPGTVTQFVDTAVSVGIHYEYYVSRSASTYNGYGYINSGIEISVVGNRGNLILVVDSTFITTLAPELKRLEDDLEGDGWNVTRLDVLRTASAKHVKSRIVSTYTIDPTNTKAVFLFGHVPVPYSGNMNPDAHSDHIGAWPADTYYGDMNGTWTDVSVTSVTNTGSPARIQNVPGDGKFDQSLIPSDLELQVGRVDLYALPAFTLTEQQLLKNYLDKDHNYRKKVFTVTKRALVDDHFGYFSGEAFAASGWKNFSPLVGTSSVTAVDYTTSLNSGGYQWSYGCGGGTYNSASGIGSTTDISNSNLEGVFTMLFGSYFGDFDVSNSFLRAPLASGKILTNAWSGRPQWMFHHMAMGENIGYSALISQNNSIYHSVNCKRWVHTALMGDPTLRNDIVSPVSNVVATRVGNNCHISWTASTQTNVLGYNIYMKNDTNKIYAKVNGNLIAGTTYTDNCMLYPGIYKYMVRAVVLEESPSGTYFNMSEGIADTALNNSYLKVYITSAAANFTNTVYTTTFTAGATNATAYSWNFGDGGTSTQQNPVYTYTANGTYTAIVTASNSCNSATAQVVMSFDVGMNELTLPDNWISVYPNPSNGKITVSLNKYTNNPLEIKIYNTEGKLICSDSLTNTNKEIDLSRHKRGVYFIQFTDTESNRYVKKLVIE